jgi:hypothetical protein
LEQKWASRIDQILIGIGNMPPPREPNDDDDDEDEDEEDEDQPDEPAVIREPSTAPESMDEPAARGLRGR